MQVLQNNNPELISQFIDTHIVEALDSFIKDESIDAITKAAITIAPCFGVEKEFCTLIEGETEVRANAEKKLTTSFYNNLLLLVQKTWVEASDEALKNQALEKLKDCCGKDHHIDYKASYEAVIDVLHDVVYLMFGPQTKKADFSEYALRIDPGFGVFWWYLQALPKKTDWSLDKTRLALLLGMFFLANY
ncbi:MAG TPA: hypothetical protein PLR81_02810 [Treponemataceae bacterium]|nr:hypothetical protein [Treponemataceae bacterium]